jgi:hypothetical protein
MKCPLPECGQEMIGCDIANFSAKLTCPSVAHYVFYDETQQTYYATSTKTVKRLQAMEIGAEWLPPQSIMPYITSKGGKGPEALLSLLHDEMPSIRSLGMGRGATADYFVFNPENNSFCFLEVKTSKSMAKLRPDQREFSKSAKLLNAPFYMVWLNERADKLSFWEIDENGYAGSEVSMETIKQKLGVRHK